MPKVKALGLYAEKDIEFSSAIASCMVRSRKKTRDLIKKTGTSESTHYNRLRNPEDMTIKELRVYVNETNIPEEDVLNAIYLKRQGEQAR